MEDDPPRAPITDPAVVRPILIKLAKAGRDTTYAELLYFLGHAFSRPRMRVLCRTLDAIDVAGRLAGEPELAVLVVRQADRLPGQGWWMERRRRLGYQGPWTGAAASRFVRERQALAFAWWRKA